MPVSAPTLAAEAVLFAINSAIELSRNVQRAYAQSLQGRILVLPLPGFDTNIDLATMIAYFQWSPELLKDFDDLRKLLGSIQSGIPGTGKPYPNGSRCLI